MKKLGLVIIFAMAIVFFFESAHAALYVRGFGTITGDSGHYKLIYEDGLDITILDYVHNQSNWQTQMEWADSLEVTFNGLSFDDWRLPRTMPVDGQSYNYEWRDDGSSDFGYDISAPGTIYEGNTNSEMAYLYYNIDVFGPFDNSPLVNYPVWSGTEFPLDEVSAWYFRNGKQDIQLKEIADIYAVAFMDGDVISGQVPVPGAVWLLGPGLLGLIGLRKRLNKKSS